MSKTKEAIAIVLDIGPSMRQESFNYLQRSLDTISLIIQRKIFSESKDEIALIFLGTKNSNNALSTDTEYTNITTQYELVPASFEMLQFLKKYTPDMDAVDADFVDAIVVAMDELIKKTEGRKGYGSRRLVLFSCGCGKYNGDQIDEIISSCQEANIDLNVIGPDLSTESQLEFSNGHGDCYKVKSRQQLDGETILKKFVLSLEGTSFTFEEVMPYLQYIQKRETRSTAWKVPLKISNNLEIPICLYSKIKAAKANIFKSVYNKNIDSEIITSRTYHLKDDDETEIQKEDVIDGYRFGDILVPVSKDDKDAMKLKTEKSFKLLGFTKSENVKPEMYMGDTTWICVADSSDEAGSAMLSSLIRVCYMMNMVGIVRRVYAAHGQVKIGCLVPHIKTEFLYFYYIELPFAEDVRPINMPSLPISATNSGTPLNNKPTDEQLGLIDELMAAMDLSRDSISKDVNNFKYNKVFNPYLQRLYQCLEHRALHPCGDLPGPTEAILNLTKIPEHIVKKSRPIFDNMKKAFVLESNVEDSQASRQNIFLKSHDDEKMDANADSNINLTNFSSLNGLLKLQITSIGSINPVQDFLVLLTQTENKKEVIAMMGRMVLKLIMDSFSNELFPKVFGCLLSMRQQCIMHDLSDDYNQFLEKLRDELKSSGRLSFMNDFAASRRDLGLISCDEDKTLTDIDEERCSNFIKSLLKGEEPMLLDSQHPDDDDLIDELE